MDAQIGQTILLSYVCVFERLDKADDNFANTTKISDSVLLYSPLPLMRLFAL